MLMEKKIHLGFFIIIVNIFKCIQEDGMNKKKTLTET